MELSIWDLWDQIDASFIGGDLHVGVAADGLGDDHTGVGMRRLRSPPAPGGVDGMVRAGLRTNRELCRVGQCLEEGGEPFGFRGRTGSR
jgi:hypothetical protein